MGKAALQCTETGLKLNQTGGQIDKGEKDRVEWGCRLRIAAGLTARKYWQWAMYKRKTEWDPRLLLL